MRGDFVNLNIRTFNTQRSGLLVKCLVIPHDAYSSRWGTSGGTQVYNIEKKALASNHVNIVRLKNGYNPNYIGFVMNSQIGRMQTEQLSAGSAQAELYPKDIDNFLIPIIDIEIQDEIVSNIEISNALKEQSEQLLDLAKTAVEKAIEEMKKRR